MLSHLAEVTAYAASQKIVAPRRWRAWKRLTQPFVHTGEAGLRFELHPPELIDGYIYVEGIYERRVLRLLRKHLTGRTMLDIGANIGNHALYLARCFRAVHCFEPNPVTVQRLRCNVGLNAAATIEVHPVALGDRREDLPFRSNDQGNLGGGSFVREQFPVSHTLPVYHGDEYLASRNIRDVDFIKLDVEGFELKVLRGLAETIRRDRPIIAFEYDHQWGNDLFGQFRQALPAYVFTEAIRVSPRRSALGRLAFAMVNGIEPPLVELDQPEPRFYEALLGFPSRAALEKFRAGVPRQH